jgi:ribonuclease P protein component
MDFARGWRRAEAAPSSSAAARGGGSVSPPEGAPPVQRRHRLSRSRDFDTVYRHGKSVSTRYLTLHWFPREDDAAGEPRLGLAVPRAVGSAVARNRVKRILREAWRGSIADVPPGRDYVLVARPGLAEPAEARGPDWIAGEIAEALGKIQA